MSLIPEMFTFQVEEARIPELDLRDQIKLRYQAIAYVSISRKSHYEIFWPCGY